MFRMTLCSYGQLLLQKREGRVLDRWKKLIRGVLIRERVKRTYSML